MRLLALLTLTLAACSAHSPAEREELAARPNIVVLFLDDAGYGDFGCYGHPTIRTPNLDRMAAEGMRFTQFYSASPACTASRYAILTGRLPVRSGFAWVLFPGSERGLHPEELTVAEALQDQGYATACFGKWHLGHREEFLPTRHGFDEYFGLPYSNDMQPPKNPPLPLIDGETVVETDPDQRRLTREYTERALRFMEEHRERPFFVYLPYAMPHVPLHPGEDFAGRSPRGLYGDVIEEIDWSVGAVLRCLEEGGLAERTLVFVTSDNGPWIIRGEKGGSAGLLRDGKGSTWEGGIRVPGIAWWPGTVPAGSVTDSVASTTDLAVTAMRLAGHQDQGGRRLDGRDLLPVLTGDAAQEEEIVLFCYGPEHELHAVRRGPWKLHLRTSSQTGRQYFDGRVPLLFHLERDPSEQYDRSADHPEIVEELQLLAERHRQSVAAEGSFWDR